MRETVGEARERPAWLHTHASACIADKSSSWKMAVCTVRGSASSGGTSASSASSALARSACSPLSSIALASATSALRTRGSLLRRLRSTCTQSLWPLLSKPGQRAGERTHTQSLVGPPTQWRRSEGVPEPSPNPMPWFRRLGGTARMGTSPRLTQSSADSAFGSSCATNPAQVRGDALVLHASVPRIF